MTGAYIHLVRHCAHGDIGEILSGRFGGGLTAEGRARAHWLAGEMARGEPIAAIHSSPQRRALETADAIAERLSLKVRVVAALDEIDFGRWTGRSFTDLEDDDGWRSWNASRSTACPPDGETMGAAVSRAVMHVEAVASGRPRAAVVCVSHCDIIRGIVAHYLGLGLDNLLRFDVDPGSISTLIVGPWGGRVHMLNGETA